MYSCERIYKTIFPFWDKISNEEQETLCRRSIETSYAKNAVVHGGGANCTGAIIVKTGCLRVYLMSEDGKEVTLYRLYPNDVCMLSASCVLQAITFDVFVDADEKSECYIINGRALMELSERNLYVKNYALEMAVSRFSDVMWVMQQILFLSLDKRLGIFLWDELSKTDGDKIKLTHEHLAKYMGSAREVITRMLKYFASEGIVEVSRGYIKVIDKEKLRSLALNT